MSHRSTRYEKHRFHAFGFTRCHTTVKAAVAVSVLLERKRVGFDVTGANLQGEYTEDEIVYARPPNERRATQ